MASASFVARWMRASLVILALTGAGAATLYIVSQRTGGDWHELAQRLPANTGNVVFTRGLDRLLETVNTLAERPGATAELKQSLAELRSQGNASLGFDASTAEGWRQGGFDLGRAGAVSATGAKGDPFTFAYLAITDERAALGTLERGLGHLAASTESVTLGGRTMYRVHWPAGASSEPSTPRAYAVDRGYLVVASSEEPAADATAALNRQLADPGGLDASPEFRRALAAAGDPWLVFGYLAPALAQRGLQESGADPALAPLASGGASFALGLTNERISARIRILGDPKSPLAWPALSKPGTNPALHVPGEALAAARVSVDPAAVLKQLGATPAGQRSLERAQAFLAAHQLDLQRDVIENLDGQLAAVALAPEAQGRLPVDAIAAAGIKDAKRAAALLAALRELFPTASADGTDWYRVDPAEIGVSGSALLAVIDAKRAASLRQALEAGAPGFSLGLPAPVRDALTSGPPIYAYVDLARIADVLSRSPGAYRERAGLVRGLQGASLGIAPHDAALHIDLDLWPPPGGFERAFTGPADAGAP